MSEIGTPQGSHHLLSTRTVRLAWPPNLTCGGVPLPKMVEAFEAWVAEIKTCGAPDDVMVRAEHDVVTKGPNMLVADWLASESKGAA